MYFSLNFTEKYKVCNDQNLFEDVASLMKVLWASFCIVQNYSEIKGDQKKVYAPQSRRKKYTGKKTEKEKEQFQHCYH